ncbi:MAG: ornithine carbamoyltransferase [Nitrospinae bacterium]|nr:ornithine carbamoyltransferase [Nitrospinota bacterium]
MKTGLLRLPELGRENIEWIFKTAARLKREKAAGVPHRLLEGKTLGMLFNKSSTRTRISFEVGMFQLGGHAVVLSGQQLQMGRGETVADTARVFSRYLDGIVVRTFGQEEVEELAAHASIPVINALTDEHHPCQILTDMFTIIEKRGSLDGVKVAYVGDGNNIAHSWLLGAAMMGLSISIGCPQTYSPSSAIVAEAEAIAAKTGGKVVITHDPMIAAKDAHVLYTDTWISMGQDEEAEERRTAFSGFCIDGKLLGHARKDALVMHCLPAHRGEEVTGEVIDGPNSVVWDQAENRLHTQKAILVMLMAAGA